MPSTVSVLIPLLAAFAAASITWLATHWNETLKWRRSQIVRWDERRYYAYYEYAAAVKAQVNICLRLAHYFDMGTRDVSPIDPIEGQRQLAEADVRRTERMEGLLLLATEGVITAAQRWNAIVWKLAGEVTVTVGSTYVPSNDIAFNAYFEEAGKARQDFHDAARQTLSVTGSLPTFVRYEGRPSYKNPPTPPS